MLRQEVYALTAREAAAPALVTEQNFTARLVQAQAGTVTRCSFTLPRIHRLSLRAHPTDLAAHALTSK
jgi:hypothetical protein